MHAPQNSFITRWVTISRLRVQNIIPDKMNVCFLIFFFENTKGKK